MAAERVSRLGSDPLPLDASRRASLRRRTARFIIPPLWFVSLACQLDRSNLSFAALQMRSELSFFTRTVQGLGSGLFFVGYLLQVPANLACVALGPRRWLPILLAVWGAVAMCFAAVRGTTSFLVLRLLLGVAEAGAYPAIMYCLSLFFPPRNLGLAYTVVATATAVAGLVGGPLAAGIMMLDGVAGLRGWQWLFLIEGALPLLLACALPLALPSCPLTARFLAPEERRWLWQEVSGVQDGIELVPAGGPAAEPGRAADEERAGMEQAGEAWPAGEPAGSEDEAAEAARPAAAAGAEGADAAGRDGESARLLAAHKRGGSSDAAQPPLEIRADGSSSGGGGGGGAGSKEGLRAAVQRGLLDTRVWHLGAVMFLVDVSMNAVHFWLPTLTKAALEGQLLHDAEETEDEAAEHAGSGSSSPGSHSIDLGLAIRASLLTALPFCGAAVCMVANAWHSRRRDERRLHTALPMLAAAVAWGLVPLAAKAGPAAAVAALTAVASGIWSTHGPLFSWPSAFLDRKAAAMGFAAIKTAGAVGGFTGPLAVGWMADEEHGYAGAMVCLAVAAAAAGALVCVFNDARR